MATFMNAAHRIISYEIFFFFQDFISIILINFRYFHPLIEWEKLTEICCKHNRTILLIEFNVFFFHFIDSLLVFFNRVFHGVVRSYRFESDIYLKWMKNQ